jgi:hypothetical protein
MSIDLWPPLALCDPQGPWAYLFTSESASGQAFNLLHQRHGTVVRRVRGHRCRTKQTLLAEWARAFAFPPYFGHNWDAFEECLTDLDWLPAQCYIAIVSDASDVLPQDDASFATFVELLGHVATEWATPQQGERTHPSIAFRVLFHTASAQQVRVRTRLRRIGVDPIDIPLRNSLGSS